MLKQLPACRNAKHFSKERAATFFIVPDLDPKDADFHAHFGSTPAGGPMPLRRQASPGQEMLKSHRRLQWRQEA